MVTLIEVTNLLEKVRLEIQAWDRQGLTELEAELNDTLNAAIVEQEKLDRARFSMNE